MFRFVPLSLVGLPAVLLSACGGGGGNEVQSAVVPGVALAASADHFSQDVSSMTGKFTMKFTIGGTSVEMQGNYSFEAPNRGYLTMDIFGQELEMLMLPPVRAGQTAPVTLPPFRMKPLAMTWPRTCAVLLMETVALAPRTSPET